MNLLFALLSLSCCLAVHVDKHWVSEDAFPYNHMSTIAVLGPNTFAAAWQASNIGEGHHDQSIMFSISRDLGRTWTKHTKIRGNDQVPFWGPALWYHNNKLTLFFSESVENNWRSKDRWCPGGDIKMTTSTDEGKTWGPDTLLLGWQSATRGNISKVTTAKPIEIAPDTWLLPFWQEAHTKNDTGEPCAGVFISGDNGESWKPYDFLHNSKSWLIEPAATYLHWEGKAPYIEQIFRTQFGKLYKAYNNDTTGTHWTTPDPSGLPNPDSKAYISSFKGPNKMTKQAVIALNPLTKGRGVLSMVRSSDGVTWEKFVTLENDTKYSWDYPTTIFHQGYWYTTYSAMSHHGIKIASVVAE